MIFIVVVGTTKFKVLFEARTEKSEINECFKYVQTKRSLNKALAEMFPIQFGPILAERHFVCDGIHETTSVD